MTTPSPEPLDQLGLLDLRVDLSVPYIYSGTDFTVYLHIKNPFAVPVWVDAVELSLPTQLRWRMADRPDRDPASAGPPVNADELRSSIRLRTAEKAALEDELAGLAPDADEQWRRIERELRSLDEEIQRDSALLHGTSGTINLTAEHAAVVNVHGRAQHLNVTALNSSTVNVYEPPRADDPERVPLVGSLPRGVALEPGCTDVWTIRLGTGRSPLFIPASYLLQFTVVYAQEPSSAMVGTGPTPTTEPVPLLSRRRIFSNTTSLTVPVKAALWNVMAGGALGGTVGSVARSLQDAPSLDTLLSRHLGTSVGSLILAVILSGAAIVFAARKSEAQSFVTVEDFWGGLLIGFLIGYSGTAAFSEITGVKP